MTKRITEKLSESYKIPLKMVKVFQSSNNPSDNVSDYIKIDSLFGRPGVSCFLEKNKDEKISEMQKKVLTEDIFIFGFNKDSQQAEIFIKGITKTLDTALLFKSESLGIFMASKMSPRGLSSFLNKPQVLMASGRGHYVLAKYDINNNSVEYHVFTTTEVPGKTVKLTDDLINSKLVIGHEEKEVQYIRTEKITNLHSIAKIELSGAGDRYLKINKKKLLEFLAAQKDVKGEDLLKTIFEQSTEDVTFRQMSVKQHIQNKKENRKNLFSDAQI